MRVKEIVSELFQQGKNWEWRFRGSEEAAALFTVGDRRFLWQALSQYSTNPTKWEIQFKALTKDTDTGNFDVWGMTGEGHGAEVMSAAVDITRAFLKEYGDKVTELTFNAKTGEDSRASLYSRMIKRLLPTWKLSTRNTKDTGTEFHLTSPNE